MTKSSLLKMRSAWVSAYVDGDIAQLNLAESSHFFVKRGSKILTKAQQISQIQRHLSEETWGEYDFHTHDEITEISENQQWASITGKGSMRRDGKIRSRFDFLELWLVDDGRWQIATLCYDEKGFDREITAGRLDPE
ncbi:MULTISPECIES: DUF4440 domain-containing protein [Burkholderia]|uniref:DUF4440 domain-containing protein n=1 Tax=Burkholderia lata (strain ATCC 17760 / DSM 23089 / LMG 22485 / NCIMB 9086 / R18194 / 383) TaxID=482957 RepID=A0A6P2UIU9_BURL3|nr:MULTISPECIES: DUF4440 domain-containing protein [Burkholderia]MBN3843713.1 nuclear transport factor 2 family protein [Burkholderia sp. Ac-20349]VWC69789.1 hypothetical protein BLA18112_01852 [Burkholderia lata]